MSSTKWMMFLFNINIFLETQPFVDNLNFFNTKQNQSHANLQIQRKRFTCPLEYLSVHQAWFRQWDAILACPIAWPGHGGKDRSPYPERVRGPISGSQDKSGCHIGQDNDDSFPKQGGVFALVRGSQCRTGRTPPVVPCLMIGFGTLPVRLLFQPTMRGLAWGSNLAYGSVPRYILW